MPPCPNAGPLHIPACPRWASLPQAGTGHPRAGLSSGFPQPPAYPPPGYASELPEPLKKKGELVSLLNQREATEFLRLLLKKNTSNKERPFPPPRFPADL